MWSGLICHVFTSKYKITRSTYTLRHHYTSLINTQRCPMGGRGGGRGGQRLLQGRCSNWTRKDVDCRRCVHTFNTHAVARVSSTPVSGIAHLRWTHIKVARHSFSVHLEFMCSHCMQLRGRTCFGVLGVVCRLESGAAEGLARLPADAGEFTAIAGGTSKWWRSNYFTLSLHKPSARGHAWY